MSRDAFEISIGVSPDLEICSCCNRTIDPSMEHATFTLPGDNEGLSSCPECYNLLWEKFNL